MATRLGGVSVRTRGTFDTSGSILCGHAHACDDDIDDAVMLGGRNCRFCEAPLELTMVDLGKSPLCESFLPAERLETMEPFYPLHVRVCTQCWLAQLPSFVPPDEIF